MTKKHEERYIIISVIPKNHDNTCIMIKNIQLKSYWYQDIQGHLSTWCIW